MGYSQAGGAYDVIQDGRQVAIAGKRAWERGIFEQE